MFVFFFVVDNPASLEIKFLSLPFRIIVNSTYLNIAVVTAT